MVRSSNKRRIEHAPNWYPRPTVELHKLRLLNRLIVRGTRIDRDAGKLDGTLEVHKRSRLSHDVRTRQIISALSQHLYQGLGRGVTEDCIRVVLVADEQTATDKSVERLMGTKPEARFEFIQERAEFADEAVLDV